MARELYTVDGGTLVYWPRATVVQLHEVGLHAVDPEQIGAAVVELGATPTE